MKVLILGAGAIGGLIGGRLASNPALDVHLAVRRPMSALSIRRGGKVDRPSVRILDDPVGAGIYDWILVATKAYDVGGLAPWLDAAYTAGTVIAVAQNGVEHATRFSGLVPADAVMPMINTHGAERTGPGEVVHTLDGVVRVPNDKHGLAFMAMADGTGLNVEVVDQFVSALWVKLAYNLVGNSLSTITDLPVREIGRREGLRSIAATLIEECRATAATQGGVLPGTLAGTMLDELAMFPDTVHSSMWQDRQAGRRLEHEAISGAVARMAAQNGINAPYSHMVTHLLEALSARANV